MSSFLLGLTLLAVAWLAIWSVKDHSKASKTWWPFAMREEGTAPKRGATTPRSAAGQRSQTTSGRPAPRPWRRSGF